MVNCCNHTKKHKSCIRKSDKKSFKLPRKFSKKRCKNPKGFTMKSSCAPYKDCKSQKGGSTKKTYYFAGGCFWGIEKKFSELKGVFDTKVGYMGGSLKNPTYEQVSKGNTGHVETVMVVSNLSLQNLLKKFFEFHDYTLLDHQGPDVGPQYRAVFFYRDKNELKIFQNFIKKYKNVKTKAYPVKEFYVAEDYHQMYSFQKPCKSLKTEDKTVFDKICKNNTKKAELKNTGKYLHNKSKGIYYCSCCNRELYYSKDQYDSGTGWPAFSKSFDESHLLYNPKNDELRCSNCGLHLGHRTFDGPTSTKIHDCINSACLFFKKNDKKGGGKTKYLPQLRKIDNSHKKHKYKLSDPQKKRILAINEGINYESKHQKITKKKAAISKKARFNILRMYRKNNKPTECLKLTKDMKYIDKKYKLGKTKNICRKKQKGGSTKKLSYRKNIDNKSLKVCSKKPMTGYYRNGYCMTGPDDLGTHTVCAKMDKKFLKYTAKKGNDLSSVVKPGEKWCLCENRWNEAFLDGKSPKVIRNATNMRTKKHIQNNINSKKGGGKTKKQFLYNPDDPKKSFDVYIDKNPNDTIPIKYTTLDDVKNTIKKLEKLYKNGKYPHKRIWQVGMILRVRLKVLQSKKPKEYKLAERYFQHLGKRSKIKDKDKKKEFQLRKKFKFNLN